MRFSFQRCERPGAAEGTESRGKEMETIIRGIEGIEEAAEIIRRGGLVAFPTETVYGLGGNALSPEAARKIYAAKGRPSDNPLIVHVSGIKAAEPLVTEITEDARRLMAHFWPGPLTLILRKTEKIPRETSGGLDTVALRCPENACALRLISESGVPIAAPSANLSGKPSPTEAGHVAKDLGGRIDMILDGGPVGIGVESSILDLSTGAPILLRPGAVTAEELSAFLGQKVGIDPAILSGTVSETVHPRAPGMKYRHYAPEAEMYLVTTRLFRERGEAIGREERELSDRRTARWIRERAERELSEGRRVGILCVKETRPFYPPDSPDGTLSVKVLGSREEMLTMTRSLFRLLREFDEEKKDRIYAESCSDRGVGFALMNRMRKAAGMREIIL